jgi:glycosyltransferase involved in cell wall biosynthesis
MTLRYSVVIPAYNEAKLLPRLLASLDVARAAYGPAEAIEVIVADNVSTDGTAAIAEARGCRVASVEKRVIAAVRNGGARAARGEVLAFVDADSQVHSRTFIDIDEALASGRVVGGATGATLERWSPGIALCYFILLPIALFTGMDTGVVFVRRNDFEEVGGYDENRLVAEDIGFLLALKRLGKTRGQRLRRVTSAKVIVSTRKFDEFGDWHLFAMIGEGLRHLTNRKPTEFTDKYWYKPRR